VSLRRFKENILISDSWVKVSGASAIVHASNNIAISNFLFFGGISFKVKESEACSS
jgi:hypothetical protein